MVSEPESEMLKLSYMDADNEKLPVIGMLTKSFVEEGYNAVETFSELLEPQYIHIFRGANVIPISVHAPREEIERLMLQTNALCLPGGHCNIYTERDGKRYPSLFTQAGRDAIEIAIKINQAGTYYPVYGVCLGFELLAAIIAKDINIVEPCAKCCDYHAVLQFTSEAPHSKLVQAFSPEQRERLQTQQLSYNYHSYMVDYHKLMENKGMSEFFHVIALSPASDNSYQFVSMIEGKKYPFYAVQHHPEWGIHNFYLLKLTALQTPETARIAYAIGDFFVSEAKKNTHQFKSRAELKASLVTNAKVYIHEEKGSIYLLPLMH